MKFSGEQSNTATLKRLSTSSHPPENLASDPRQHQYCLFMRPPHGSHLRPGYYCLEDEPIMYDTPVPKPRSRSSDSAPKMKSSDSFKDHWVPSVSTGPTTKPAGPNGPPMKPWYDCEGVCPKTTKPDGSSESSQAAKSFGSSPEQKFSQSSRTAKSFGSLPPEENFPDFKLEGDRYICEAEIPRDFFWEGKWSLSCRRL